MIDDSDLALEFQQMLLARAGIEARGITSMEELGGLAADWPHFVLVDANMPDAEPEEVCRAAREHHPAAMIVLVSGLELDDLRPLARRCNADGFVSKSDNIKELPQILRSLVPRAVSGAPSERDTRLRGKLLALVDERVAEVRAHVAAIAAGAEDAAARQSAAARLLHTIKGEAGLLGLTALAADTAALEQRLSSAAGAGFAADAAATREFTSGLDALADSAKRLKMG